MSFVAASNIKSSGKASAERLCDSSITYPFICSSCSSTGSKIALKMKGERGSPCLTPLSSETSVFDPAYLMDVVRLAYKFIMDSRTPFGSPRHSKAASMALCGTVSKALAV